MKKNALLILAASLLLFSSSCYYDALPPEEEIVFEPDQDISFADAVLPIINSNNCATCHNGSQDPDLRAANAFDALVPEYVVAFDADNSLFFQRLPVRENSNHPNVGSVLTDNEVTTIREWIDRGALE